jgi:hypothetical protein
MVDLNADIYVHETGSFPVLKWLLIGAFSFINGGCVMVGIPSDYTRTTAHGVEHCHQPFEITWMFGERHAVCDGREVVIDTQW